MFDNVLILMYNFELDVVSFKNDSYLSIKRHGGIIMSLTQEQFDKIQSQMNKKNMVPVKFEGQTLYMDHKIIYLSDKPNNNASIVLMTGWGSGLEGIVLLALALAQQGYTVHLFSMLGYCNSSNPKRNFYAIENYLNNAADVLAQAIKYVGLEKVHLIGHSMGFQVVLRVAAKYPNLIQSVRGLNPSGVFDIKGCIRKSLHCLKFFLSGLQLKIITVEQDKYHQKLADWCKKQKNPFWGWRWLQRINEFFALAVDRERLLEFLRKVQCPVVCVAGSKDIVFPYSKLLDFARDTGEIVRVYVGKFNHNPTLSIHFAQIAAKLLSKTMR